MTTEPTGQPTAEQRIAQLEADANKYREQAQTWMGKFTTVEKTLNGKSLESLIAAAEERDILAKQAAEKDPKKFDEELERRVNAVTGKYEPLLSEKDKEINTVKGQLKEYRIVDAFVSEASDKLYPKAIEDFKNYLRKHCDLDESGNTVIKDADGKVRLSPTKAGTPMTKTELIAELMDSHDHWFVNKVPAGGKTNEQKMPGGGGELTIDSLNRMSPEARTKALAEAPDAVRKALVNQLYK